MLGIAIHCIQHSQAMLECGVCELAHSFFHFRNSLNQFKSFFSRIHVPAIYMYVDIVDVLLNDSNKKNKEQFNSKQHKVNNITIYSKHEFQN